MRYVVDTKNDPNGTGNGDVAIRTEKGTLVALVYAGPDAGITAKLIVNILNGEGVHVTSVTRSELVTGCRTETVERVSVNDDGSLSVDIRWDA